MQEGKPVVLVNTSGSAVNLSEMKTGCRAILQCFYPGAEGGHALADVLFGAANPCGKLPVTFYRSVEDLPDFRDYAMTNRTYRYFDGPVVYPFGYGLSYTTFTYGNLEVSEGADGLPVLHVAVTNTGEMPGSETVQFYLKDMEASVRVPRWKLICFQKAFFQPQETKRLSCQLTWDDVSLFDETGALRFEPGDFCVCAGGSSPWPEYTAGVVSEIFSIQTPEQA